MKKICLAILFSSSIILGLAQSTDGQLTTQSDVIRNETTPGGNTRTRVADMYQAIINSKVNKRTPVFLDSADITKRIKFHFDAGHPTATTYDVTWPAKDGTVAYLDELNSWLTGNLTSSVNITGGVNAFQRDYDNGSTLTSSISENASSFNANFSNSFTGRNTYNSFGISFARFDIESDDANLGFKHIRNSPGGEWTNRIGHTVFSGSQKTIILSLGAEGGYTEGNFTLHSNTSSSLDNFSYVTDEIFRINRGGEIYMKQPSSASSGHELLLISSTPLGQTRPVTKLGIGSGLSVSGGNLISTGGFSDPMTTRGDIIYRNSSNATARLGAGTAGQVLTSDGTDIAWATPTGESTSNKATTLATMDDTLYPTTDALFQSREVTGTGAIVQSDNGGVVYFNSGTPFNFTIDALSAKTQVSFINIGSADVTFVNGSGVTFSGSATLSGGSNSSAAIVYHTSTAPIILSGGGGGSGNLDVGTTVVDNGTSTRVLYNNAGVLGEYAISGTGNVAMTNSPTFTTPNIGTATGTASGNWSLANGGTLSGVNTISNGTANGLVFSGSPTFSSDGHYHIQQTPTITFGSNASHVQGIFNIGGSLTAGVNNQVMRGLVINPTYGFSSFTRANYSNLGLDIRDGGTANGGFKFYTDAFTNTTNSFQMISRTGVTTLEQVVDSGGASISSNSGKTLTFSSGSTFRILLASSRVVELANTTLDMSRTLFGPAWSGTATTSTATQQSSNGSLAFQGRGWNGSSAVTTYMYDNFIASTSTNLLFNQTRKFWNGSTANDIWNVTSTGMMFLGGGTEPTATLHLAAGTTSRAPFKLTSGTNLTTPEAGAVEYDGTNLYFTPSSTRNKVVLQGSESTNIVVTDASASRKTYEMKFFDGSGATGNQDWDLFSGLSDAVIQVTFNIVGIKDDGSEIYTATKSASFKKDGAATPVLIGSVTTIAEVIEDGVDNPSTTISVNSGSVRLAVNSGSSDVYRWTCFAKVTQTIL